MSPLFERHILTEFRLLFLCFKIDLFLVLHNTDTKIVSFHDRDFTSLVEIEKIGRMRDRHWYGSG